MIILSAVMAEAAAVGFPMRLAWMLVCNYQQPRRIKGFNSLSRSYTSFQGILAGCSHATTLMQVLLLRPLQRLKREFEFVVPRGLMDDVSFQWIGRLAKYAGVVFNAVTAFAGYTRQLGFLLQASKSGYLASSTEAARAVKSRAARLKLQAFRTARNLGHDTFAGGTAHRALERKKFGGGAWEAGPALRP